MERITLSGGGSKVNKDVWDVENNNNNNLKYDKDYPYEYPWPPRYYTCSFCQREFKSAQALGGHMNIHRRDRARLRDQSPPPNDPLCPNDFDQNSILNSNPNPNPNLDPNPNPNPNNPNNPNPNNPNNPNPNPNNPNPNNPNPNNNSNIYAHQYSLVSLSLSSLPPPPLKNDNGEKLGPTIMESSRDELGKWKYMSSSFNPHHHGHEVRVLNNENSTKEFMRLDLELCLGESKQDLDLELRLGI